MAYLTATEAIDRLRERCSPHGATREFAREVGCSDAYIYAIKNGKAAMSERVASALGLRAVQMFEEINDRSV